MNARTVLSAWAASEAVKLFALAIEDERRRMDDSSRNLGRRIGDTAMKDLYILTFNDSPFDLPEEIDDDWTFNHSFYHLEGYTDQIHLVNTELAEKVHNDEASDEEEDSYVVASWEAK